MTLSDSLNILAILLSPLIALQVSRRLDDRKERKQRKMWVWDCQLFCVNDRFIGSALALRTPS
jgi:hypothetical protein